MKARCELINAVAQAARDPVAHVQRVMQMGLGVAVVGGGFAAFQRQVAEGVGGVSAQLGQAGSKVLAVPEVFGGAGVFLELDDVQRLDEDDDPRGQRHGQQQDGDGAGDKVTLDPDVGDAELRFHEKTP
ncbi:hypothetical protein D3C72_1970410 [compost metagenome]